METNSLPETITVNGVPYRRGNVANRVGSHVMYGCHLFRPLKGVSVQALVDDWLKECMAPSEMGAPYLCPLIVLDGDKELRRVGQMVFANNDDTDKRLGEWIRLANADPDIPRILSERLSDCASGDGK